MAKPKPIAVVDDQSQSLPGPIDKNKHRPAERLCVATHNRFYVANYDMCRRPRACSQAFNPIDFFPMAGDT